MGAFLVGIAFLAICALTACGSSATESESNAYSAAHGRRSGEGGTRGAGMRESESENENENENVGDDHEGGGKPPPPMASPDAGSPVAEPDAGPPAPPPPSPDAGMMPPLQPPPDAGMMPPPPPPPACDAPVTAPNGHHNPGMDCMSCHAGVSGFVWTVSGTLYSSVSGGAAVSGATIEVVDATGATIKIPTASNGNFFTTQPVTFPIHVKASLCPNTVPMNSAASSGSCNSCHGSALRVHLP